jgi:membrane-bound serine protease (ClpP class)
LHEIEIKGTILEYMKTLLRIIIFLSFIAGSSFLCAREPNSISLPESKQAQAAIIVCKGLIDDGLYKSIKRRTDIALNSGVNYLIYEIETYGGEVKAADDISKYFILDVAKRAHTVAYVNTEAISAGAMISVSCKDIIMRKSTTIGDCAPILLGGKLEGVEREKQESFVRATFARAAETNKYPQALLKAMVSIGTEVYRVKNLETGEYEFFETEFLPKDANEFDIENKELIVKKEHLLTLTASKAAEYGIARAVVNDVNGVLEFLEKRDGVSFASSPVVLPTNWSEEMVRWLNSPAVMGVLVMIALLGLYVEFNTPGVWLPGLIAVICFAIIIGSKFLIGMANWVEVALFVAGVLMLLVELTFLPSLGFLAVIGLVCMIVGLFGMLIKNPPDRLPWPETDFDWQWFLSQVWAIGLGFLGFVIAASFLRKYLPRTHFFSRLMLTPATAKTGREVEISMTAPAAGEQVGVRVGDVGEAMSLLRPAGKARFGDAVVDVVAEGEYISKSAKIKITEIHGNRVVVREDK